LESSPASESTVSECTCNSMHNLSQLSTESSAKLSSNSAQTLHCNPVHNGIQTLHCNPEQEEQYLYKKRKLLQETGIFKILRVGRSDKSILNSLSVPYSQFRYTFI